MLAERLAPGVSAQPLRKRWRYGLVCVISGVLLAVLSAFLGQVANLPMIPWLTKKQNEADDAEDAKKPPFTVTAKRLYEKDKEPDYLINEPFSGSELKYLIGLRLTDARSNADFDAFMKKKKARLVNTPSFTTLSPAYATAYQVDVFSEKENALSITGLEAKDIKCRDVGPAKAVIHFPGQGEVRAGHLLIDLDSRPEAPIATGEGDPYEGEPYFSHYRITVGGSATPGPLRMEAATGRGVCTFKLKALYSDKDGKRSTTMTNDGKPFIAESSPKLPQQEIVYSIPDRSFVNCATRWVSGCSEFWK
ncbi:hypothetical protein [Streptomyces sp. NPDC017673]|uniref:hypothetical protein n=1 Tax=unclassified Streptomyces TaxID=2593676 RepID=UPI0037ABF829